MKNWGLVWGDKSSLFGKYFDKNSRFGKLWTKGHYSGNFDKRSLFPPKRPSSLPDIYLSEGVCGAFSQILPKNIKFYFTNMFIGLRSLNFGGGVKIRNFFNFPTVSEIVMVSKKAHHTHKKGWHANRQTNKKRFFQKKIYRTWKKILVKKIKCSK